MAKLVDTSKYIRSIYRLKNKVDNQRVINERLEELRRKQKEVEDLLSMVITVRTLYEQYKDLCIKEENDYKRRRKMFIEDYISDNLRLIFEDEILVAKIEENKKNGYNRVELNVIDEQGNVRNPSITEGQFCQQLIALSAVVATVHNAKANKIYVDEAFSMASPDNLVKVSGILDKIRREGVQCIIISQHAELYRDITRREITLDYSYLTGTTKIASIVDYQGVDDIV